MPSVPQVLPDLVDSAELRDRRPAASVARNTRPMTLATLRTLPRSLRELVDAAQDQAVQALGQLEPSQARSSRGSTPWLLM